MHFSAGKSAAFVTTLLPVTATPVFVREPTELGDGPYYANEPPEGSLSVRVEVRSPLGDLECRFLHAFVATQADTTPPPAIRIDGRDVDGAAIEDEAYVFSRAGVQARAAPIAYRAPAAALRHVVASLPPGARYTVTVERDGTLCSVSRTRCSECCTRGVQRGAIDVRACTLLRDPVNGDSGLRSRAIEDRANSPFHL